MINVLILAGGFGTRLLKVVKDIPKPMAPVNNQPFLGHQLKLISKSLTDYHVYVLTHHKSEIIERFVENMSNVSVIKESKPLGTGGAIKHALQKINDNKSKILILNGDSYVDTDFSKFINKSKGDINILCCKQENCDRFATVEINNNLICKFNEKKSNVRNSYISAGCYYFKNTKFFDIIDEDVFMIENIFEKICQNNMVYGYICNNTFFDIGIPEDYKMFCEYMKNE